MMSNSTGNMTLARKQAQANANSFGVSYVIFCDTSGNLHIERESVAPKNVNGIREVIQPQRDVAQFD